MPARLLRQELPEKKHFENADIQTDRQRDRQTCRLTIRVSGHFIIKFTNQQQSAVSMTSSAVSKLCRILRVMNVADCWKLFVIYHRRGAKTRNYNSVDF